MIGQRINNYEILEQIGEGGMGTVYLARHPFIGRKAAIKVLRPELARDRDLASRFLNEARAANAIRHPNIIDILDVGMLPDGMTPYMMMEFLDGEPLANRIKSQGQISVAQAIAWTRQTASALAAAHEQGIVHRDLKPENLYLVRDPNQPAQEIIKVLDFGIAKLRGDLGGGSVKTQTGAVMGTPPYMSPEQCQGISELIDHRTDVYALGIIAYEMMCGQPPFIGAGFGEVLVMHLTHTPRPPRAWNPDIPAAVEAVLLRALAKKPEERFASMADFARALDEAGHAFPAPPSMRARLPAPAAQQDRPTTTLSTAIGEHEPELRAAGAGKRNLVIGLAGVVSLAGASAAFLLSGRASGPAPGVPTAAAVAAASAPSSKADAGFPTVAKSAVAATIRTAAIQTTATGPVDGAGPAAVRKPGKRVEPGVSRKAASTPERAASSFRPAASAAHPTRGPEEPEKW